MRQLTLPFQHCRALLSEMMRQYREDERAKKATWPVLGIAGGIFLAADLEGYDVINVD